MDLPIPPAVVYAGLVGVVVSLIVAVATNNWSLRVFFLLALRLAIGWHFLFEGLHKVHSTYVGPAETNRVFTSEPYFNAAEGPLGDYMRKKYLGDPDAANAARLTPPKPMTADQFAKLSKAEQADLCPAEAAREIEAGADPSKKGAVPAVDAKAMFAGWVYGTVRRDAKVKFITGEVPLTAPQRLEEIALLEQERDAAQTWDGAKLGTGHGIDQKNVAGLRTDVRNAKSDLVKDTDAFITELNKLAGGEGAAAAKEKPIESLDWRTRWGITAIGAGLLLGLLTRLWCVAGAGFLFMTYAAHPTVPWLPLPPMTEGNPLFVNKNIIEALALLALATFPTGRWLGLDALLYYFWTARPARPRAGA